MSDVPWSEAWWWPYVFILLVGWLPTDIWRWIGVIAAGRLDADSEVLIWVRAVATALVAGVIAKLILFPIGTLETAPMAVRIAAAVSGFAVSLVVPRLKILIGIATAEAVLLGGWFASQQGFLSF